MQVTVLLLLNSNAAFVNSNKTRASLLKKMCTYKHSTHTKLRVSFYSPNQSTPVKSEYNLVFSVQLLNPAKNYSCPWV